MERTLLCKALNREGHCVAGVPSGLPAGWSGRGDLKNDGTGMVLMYVVGDILRSLNRSD
jgi:hypothetical protein